MLVTGTSTWFRHCYNTDSKIHMEKVKPYEDLAVLGGKNIVLVKHVLDMVYGRVESLVKVGSVNDVMTPTKVDTLSSHPRRIRRGGWNVVGQLKGGHPDPPLKKPIFASFDSTDSDDSAGDRCKFATFDNPSSIETSSEEEEFTNVNVKSHHYHKSLPTIHAKVNKDMNKDLMLNKKKCDCDNKCLEFVVQFTNDPEKDLKVKNEGQSLIEKKNTYLSHLKAQSEILGEIVDGFFYGGHLFCVSAFYKLTGVSRHILHKIKDAHQQGLDQFVHANSLVPKISPNKQTAVC